MNPYAPGQPADPEAFAGRNELLRRFSDAIEGARQHHRSAAILLYGYRGSGKTSAIRKLRAIAREAEPRAISVELPLRESAVSEVKLLLALLSEVRREARDQATIPDRLKMFLERITSLSLGPVGVTLSLPTGTENVNALTLWRECTSALDGIPFLLLCIDDAEALADDGLGTLKTIAEAQSPTPVVLVVAGGWELSDRLAEKLSSPVGRVFSGGQFDIGEFSRGETDDALNVPIARTGAPCHWTQDGRAKVHELSHGYPYLVQCLAYAAFQEGFAIDAESVEASLSAALGVASPWLKNECADASDNDIIAFLKVASTGEVSLRSSQIVALGIQSQYLGRLVRQQILKKVSRGHYELRKAPAIAYYHTLVRRIADQINPPSAT
jgi:hypothetical protein